MASTSTNQLVAEPSPSSTPSHSNTFLNTAFSSSNRTTAKRFFSAYAQTWLGLSPLWLMGEALHPNKKVGSQFNKGRKDLMNAALEVREMVATSGKDVVVIIDEKLKSGGGTGREAAEKTAEVIKAAGENAILVVTSSLAKLSSSLSSSKSQAQQIIHDPALKHALHKHGRDALVLLDNSLKHPFIVTGVSSFAKSRGIPHADALLRLASLGLNKILKAMPIPEGIKQDVQQTTEAKIEEIEEIDAEELERRSTQEEREEAANIGKVADRSPTPRVEVEGHGAGAPGNKDGELDRDPYAEMKKRNDCIVM